MLHLINEKALSLSYRYKHKKESYEKNIIIVNYATRFSR